MFTFIHRLFTALLFGSLLATTGCQGDSGRVAETAARIVITHAAELQWQSRDSGVQIAVLYGDRTKAEPFGLRLRYPAGYRKDPHYHSSEAFVTVLSGSYYRGYGCSFDRTAAIHLVAGTFSVNPAGVAHYEWVENPAELEVHAVGPWGSVYVDAEGRALPREQQQTCGDACGGSAGAMALEPAVPAAQRPPTVLRPDQLTWAPRADGDEVAILLGDPARNGPFVVRIRSSGSSREEPHHHPRGAIITVLDGEFRFGTGATVDASEASVLRLHDLIELGAGQAHFKWNERPSVVEVRASGPWRTTWLPR